MTLKERPVSGHPAKLRELLPRSADCQAVPTQAGELRCMGKKVREPSRSAEIARRHHCSEALQGNGFETGLLQWEVWGKPIDDFEAPAVCQARKEEGEVEMHRETVACWLHEASNPQSPYLHRIATDDRLGYAEGERHMSCVP